MDTLLSLQVFRLVAELGSFAASARRLDISAPMVSKHVAHLERHLGARLLHRSSRHVSLTEAGRICLEPCQEMLDNLDQLQAALSQAAAAPRGALRITAPIWFANPVFAALLAEYRANYPAVRLELDLSGRMVDLVEEGFDLGLRITHSPGAMLVARPLGPVRMQLVGAPAYLQRVGHTPQQPEDLQHHDMIVYRSGLYGSSPAGIRLPLQGPTGEVFIQLEPVLQVNHESMSHQAALAGMGLTFLPSWLIDQDIQAGRLQAVLPGYTLAPGCLYAVYSSRRYLSPKVRTFVDFLVQRLVPDGAFQAA